VCSLCLTTTSASNSPASALAIDPPIVSISAIANYDWKGDIGVQPLQVDMWFCYDNNLKLVRYDISMHRFSWLFGLITPLIGTGIAKELNITGPDALDYECLMQMRAALDICVAHDQYCTSENQQVHRKVLDRVSDDETGFLCSMSRTWSASTHCRTKSHSGSRGRWILTIHEWSCRPCSVLLD
jgi:hypothetical protein